MPRREAMYFQALTGDPATGGSRRALVHPRVPLPTGWVVAVLGAWAVLLLGAYYLQLWRALAAGGPLLDAAAVVPGALRSVVPIVGAVLLILTASVPAGLALERAAAWPPLPGGWLILRRAMFGALPVVLLLALVHPLMVAGLDAVLGARLPYVGEAAARALTGVAGATLVILAAIPAGGAACRILGWRAADWRDEVLYHTAVGLGVVSAVCAVLALAGLFRPFPIQLAVILMAIAGLPRLWTLLRRAGRWHFAVDPGGPRWFLRGLQVLVAAALVVAGLNALAPETEYDALWYHLGLPKLWLEAGRPVDLVHDYVSLYPLTWELVFTSGLVFGGPVAAKLLHFVCLPLGALAVWQLSRTVVPGVTPWMAVAMFVTAPMVLWEATTAYVDLAMGLQASLALLALLRYVDGGGSAWLRMAALTLGLAMAIKHLGLVVAAILVPGTALWLWRMNGRTPRQSLRTAAWLLAVALVLPSPWYVRNWMAAGNPVFPELYGVFGASPPERWDAQAEQGLRGFKALFGRERTVANLLTLPWDATVHGARYGGSLGPLFLLTLPALVLLRGRESRTAPWLVLFAVLYLAVWASPISSFQLRFLVPLAPVLALLAAEAVRRLGLALPPRGRGPLAALVFALLVLNLPPFTPLHERDRVGLDGWLTHVVRGVPADVLLGRESEAAYLRRHLPTYAAWQFLNAETPPGARVLTFRGGDHFYSGRRRISSVSPMARSAVWGAPAGEEDRAARALRDLEVTHVLFDHRSLETIPPTEVALIGERMRREHLERIYEDSGAVVYRVRAGR